MCQVVKKQGVKVILETISFHSKSFPEFLFLIHERQGVYPTSADRRH